MNYRHAYHAGNAADCMKHLALVLSLEQLRQKDRPFYCLDTHAGAGRYLLEAGAEADQGVRRLWPQRRDLAALRAWLDLLHAENPGKELRQYLGSPLLAARLLRPDDELILLDKVPAVLAELRQAVGKRPHTQFLEEDAYGLLARNAPPAPGRGLVLVDPAFEAVDEWERLAEALVAALQHWPQASFLVWYPVKIRGKISRLVKRLQAQSALESIELLWDEETGAERLIGSGLLLLRPIWGVTAALLAGLGQMAPLLAARGTWSVQLRAFPQSSGASSKASTPYAGKKKL